MKKIKVVLDFIKFSVAEKIAFYRNIIAQLTGNATFPTPDVPLADAKAAVDTLEASFLAARDGSHTAVATMYANEAAADGLFRLLAAYVDRVAAGDEPTLLSSGFHESKQPTAIQKETLSVNDGSHSGSVKLVAKAVDKAGAYIWQYIKDALPDNDAAWITAATTTRASYELTGLNVTARYYFRVAAVTPDGTTDFSTPVMKVVS
jgi:hypothetical protein